MFKYPMDHTSYLALLEVRHAEELFNLVASNREYLAEWLQWAESTRKVEDTQAFIQSSLLQFTNNQGFAAGVFSRGQLAGVIGYHPIDWANRKASIGYWLGQSFQGLGLMTRACSILVNYAFIELGLNRVEIRAGVDNVKSRAIPERLGFTNEGVSRQSEWIKDHFIDLVVYGKLAEDWHA